MIDRTRLELVPAKQFHLDEVAAIECCNFPCPWKRDFFLHEIFLPLRYNRVILDKGDGPFRGHVLAYQFSHYVVPELHISKIATHRAFQRRGLAALLMEDVFLFCETKGISDITLEVRVTNTPARTFYARLGFKDDYIRKHYYPDREDAVVMCLHSPPCSGHRT